MGRQGLPQVDPLTWARVERAAELAVWRARASADAGLLNRDDMRQEALIAAWLAIEHDADCCDTYLATRAHGAVVDALRRASWVPRSEYGNVELAVISADGAQHVAELIERAFHAADESVGGLSARRVVRGLQALPEPLRTVASMFGDGADPVDVARALGVSESRVSQLRGELRRWVSRRL
jgi:RNA polymerase sigma factor (sigma-70 family)